MRLILLTAALLVLSACSWGRDNAKPDLPQSDPVKPEIVFVERKVYVPIPARLTQQRPVAKGAINQCFDVAAHRGSDQATLNAQLAEIAAIQGTEVSP